MNDLKTKLTSNLDEWVDIDPQFGLKLCGDGTLVVSCLDTEESPDDGHAEAESAKRGLRFTFTGSGFGEGDQYVERFEAGDWSWKNQAQETGRKGGKAKGGAKAKSSAANGKAGGRPNTWPADNGGKWTRIKVLTGSVAGQEGWQLVDADGNLVGLFDDDGDNLHQGNAPWKGTKSTNGPGWI